MSINKSLRQEIRDFIIYHISEHPKDIVQFTQNKYGLSRTAILRYVHSMEDEGLIRITGKTNNIEYRLLEQGTYQKIFNTNSDLQEDVIWAKEIRPFLGDQKENVLAICDYGFSEIFNNAIEHSEGTEIYVVALIFPDHIELSITDNGVGIFNKIQKTYQLGDSYQAILELSKGKLTTDPGNHTGEGIFFTSRMFDEFFILSDRYNFGSKPLDIFMETDENVEGTIVSMSISKISTRTAAGIFDEYTDHEGGFYKTIVPVELARYGNENLISRSQAKRLMTRLERFRTVVLDFTGIEMIGRAFADEVFRVFANNHPQTKIIPLNENKKIRRLIDEVNISSEV